MVIPPPSDINTYFKKTFEIIITLYFYKPLKILLFLFRTSQKMWQCYLPPSEKSLFIPGFQKFSVLWHFICYPYISDETFPLYVQKISLVFWYLHPLEISISDDK